jgi:hypothetical protein
VRLRNVVINIDKATKLPRGSATAELVLQSESDDGEVLDADGAVSALVGNSFGGRPVRVERYGNSDKPKSRRSSAGEGRYFGGSMSIGIKCNQCGVVGHNTRDCMNYPPAPCHLCARTDHDPGKETGGAPDV